MKPEVKCRLRKKSFFSKKNVQNSPEGKTISMPLAQKQVKVVVLEPANFDDSQKVADYLRNNQPVVVNFEGTEGLVTKKNDRLYQRYYLRFRRQYEKKSAVIFWSVPRKT